jgi:CRISPR system Cascade subunit CasA
VNRGAPGEPAKTLRSGVVRWFTQLTTTSEIDPGKLVRLRLVGAVYGTQQSVIDEIVDDSVLLPVITLHEVNQEYGAAAVDAVSDAEEAVEALGHLAGNLARAAGRDPAASAATARDLGFGALDGPYRAWLRNLLGFPDLQTAQRQWRATVRGHLERIGRHLLDSAGPAADEGRMIDVPEKGRQLMDAGRAEHVFSARLYHVLGPPQSRAATLPVPAQAGPRLAVPDRAESAR